MHPKDGKIMVLRVAAVCACGHMEIVDPDEYPVECPKCGEIINKPDGRDDVV